MNVFYSPAYVGAAHAFETTRKARWIAESLSNSTIDGVDLIQPQSLSAHQVAQVHDPEYIRAVQTGVPRSLAESQGFTWDAGLWPMVLASNGGAVAAGLDALKHGVAGSLSSGLHHARRGSGAGFCTFNGLAIAAREALAAGAGSVLILDLDAHCGGGTASMIGDEPRIWQMDISVNSYDGYDNSHRARLRFVTNSDEYLGEIQSGLKEVHHAGPRFTLCLYNAGMDPFEGCTTGGLPGITREMLAARERLVFDWCREQGLAVAFVLAGGYLGARLDEEELVGLHRLTLSTAAESGAIRIVAADGERVARLPQTRNKDRGQRAMDSAFTKADLPDLDPLTLSRGWQWHFLRDVKIPERLWIEQSNQDAAGTPKSSIEICTVDLPRIAHWLRGSYSADEWPPYKRFPGGTLLCMMPNPQPELFIQQYAAEVGGDSHPQDYDTAPHGQLVLFEDDLRRVVEWITRSSSILGIDPHGARDTRTK